jgi:hypothetical protein
MPLPLPNLDDRTYADLLAEARSLIPSEFPEWTDHNPSDSGIVLLEMFAWLTEMVLYRVNQVPDQTIETFLQLLQGDPTWARGDRDLATAIRDTILSLRQRYRAVTADDYEQLTLHDWQNSPEAKTLGTGGVIQRVKCLPQVNLATVAIGPQVAPVVANAPELAPGHVSLVVVPSPHTLQLANPDDSVELPLSSLGANTFTISFWVLLSAPFTSSGLLSYFKQNPDLTFPQSDRWFFMAQQNQSRSLEIQFGVDRDPQRQLVYPWKADHQWHHLAGTFDGTTSQLYGDGVLVGTAQPVLNTQNLRSGLVLYVNGNSYRPGANQWDDLSGQNNHATQSRNQEMPTLFSVAGYNGKNFKVMRFNAQCGMQFPDALNVQKPFTAIIVDRYYGNPKGRTLQGRDTNWLLGKHNGRNWCFMGTVDNTIAVPAIEGVFSISTVTLSGSTATWYVDGVFKGSSMGTTAPGNLALCKGGNQPEPSQADIAAVLVWNRVLTDAERQTVEQWLGNLYGVMVQAGAGGAGSDGEFLQRLVIGGAGLDRSQAGSMQCQIAEVRLWNKVLQPQEILAEKDHQLTGREAGLVGYWALDESSGDRVYDRTPNQQHGTLRGTQWVTNPDFNLARLLWVNPALQKNLWLFFDQRRLLTTQHHIVSPEFVFMTVQTTLRLQEGASAKEMRQAATAKLLQFFDPLQGGYARQGWPFGRNVYRSEVYELLDNLPGVDYVQTVILQQQGDPPDQERDQIELLDHQLVGLKFDPAHLTLLESWQ